jgi:hypothetical protein
MPSPGDQWCSSGHKIPATPVNVVLGVADFLLLLADAPVAVLFLVEQLTLIPLITTEFCSVGAVYPGDPLASDVTDVLNPSLRGAILDKYVALIKYYAWPQYCVCDTLVPPNVSRPAPPPWPGATATPTNLCSPLDLTNQLNAIQQLEQNLWQLVSLIAMRVGAMSYQLADVHTVGGTGEMSVAGDIGVLVDGLTFAPGVGYDTSDPPRIYDLGWITFGNSNGWEPRRPIWHAPQIFLGLTPGFTKIGFNCGMATSVRITELVPSVSGF